MLPDYSAMLRAFFGEPVFFGEPNASSPLRRGSLVYVAGPLTVGDTVDPLQGWRAALAVADTLFDLGLFPLVPHLTVHWARETAAGRARSTPLWLEWCVAQVRRCDALVRLPGESPGSDLEVDQAISCGIPVFLRCASDGTEPVFIREGCFVLSNRRPSTGGSEGEPT